MKILVTGAGGQLGHELRRVLDEKLPGVAVYTDKETLDLTDRKAVESFLRAGNFSHVINCAAYTAVDRAEEEKLQCAAINTDAVANIARMADELGLRIVHISTDYVFDGRSYKPYSESDKVNPMSQYGTTKRKAETMLLGLAPESIIVRTGWLYSPYGHNFVKTILSRAATDRNINVVNDQVGTPTYAADLAEAIVTIITSQQWVPGIVNYTNEGVASWYDFATAIVRIAGVESCNVWPVGTDEYAAVAPRPHYSVLNKNKFRATYGKTIPHWEEALERCINRIKNGEGQ